MFCFYIVVILWFLTVLLYIWFSFQLFILGLFSLLGGLFLLNVEFRLFVVVVVFLWPFCWFWFTVRIFVCEVYYGVVFVWRFEFFFCVDVGFFWLLLSMCGGGISVLFWFCC